MTQLTETAYGCSRLSFIGPLQLLNGVSQQALHDFNAMMRITRRRRGEWIFLLGDPADSIYFLREGRIKITALSEDGQEVLHEIIGPGEMFGDMSAILDIPRTTSAQALEASLLCKIRRKDFETLLSMYPELSFQLLKSVGLRLKQAEAQLVNVICNDVSRRVRETLIDLMVKESGTMPDRPIKIKITQQDLANLIGASRQKTWQTLKELEDSGVLRLMYRSILVIAPNKLRNEHIPYRYGAEHAVAKAKVAAR
jgi:CRP/FNR family transcriptional regulator, cyclic AMP receptor protein